MLTLTSPRVDEDELEAKKKISVLPMKETPKIRTFEQEHPSLSKWNERITTMKFNMTQAGIIDYFIFFSLNLSRSHLFMGKGAAVGPNFLEVFFFIVTILISVQVLTHLLQHFLTLTANKRKLKQEDIEKMPTLQKMIMDMHFTPLKVDKRNDVFLIRNQSFLKQVRLLVALMMILVGQNYPTYCQCKPLLICLMWVPLSSYWIYHEVSRGMMERKIEGYAMIGSELFTSLLLLFLSIIGLFKVYNSTTFFTNAAVFCLLGGVISELTIGVLGIVFEIKEKCKKKNKDSNDDSNSGVKP